MITITPNDIFKLSPVSDREQAITSAPPMNWLK